MKPRVFAVLVCAALPLMVPQPADAQGRARGRGQNERIRFQGMDRNGDGVITRREWQGSDQSFRVHDWNDDGRLSGDEVRPGAQRVRRDREADDYTPGRGREFDDWTSEGFTQLDHNKDGRLTRDEWHYDPEAWVRADRNRDNILTRSEFLSEEGTDIDREDRFEYLDANNNGRIERREWHGAADTFEWLDRNNDGVLSRTEMIGEEAGDARESDLFASLDYNRDNRISQDEWHWSRRSFLQQDVNRDGSISREEFSDPGGPGTAQTPAADASRGIGRAVVVMVPARAGWVDTGIDVRPGDVLSIRATGNVTLSSNASDMASPGGANRRAENSPLPNHPAGALIARIGNAGAPIFIGDGRATTRLTTSGRLFLGVNDDHSADNNGQFNATITVRR
jgi:Ca2+-binding EF-hand superfamily protein